MEAIHTPIQNVLIQASQADLAALFADVAEQVRRETATYCRQLFEEKQAKRQPETPDDFIDVKGVMKMTSLSRNYIYKLAAEGGIPFSSVGTRKLFSRREIKKWLVSRRHKTNEEIEAQANRYLSNKRVY